MAFSEGLLRFYNSIQALSKFVAVNFMMLPTVWYNTADDYLIISTFKGHSNVHGLCPKYFKKKEEMYLCYFSVKSSPTSIKKI